MPKPKGRTCTSCRKYKTMACFHRNKGRSKGHNRQCRDCRSTYFKARYRTLTPEQFARHREQSKNSMRRHRAALQASS